MQPNVCWAACRNSNHHLRSSALSSHVPPSRVLSRHFSPPLSDSITPSSSTVFIISIVVAIALSSHRIQSTNRALINLRPPSLPPTPLSTANFILHCGPFASACPDSFVHRFLLTLHLNVFSHSHALLPLPPIRASHPCAHSSRSTTSFSQPTRPSIRRNQAGTHFHTAHIASFSIASSLCFPMQHLCIDSQT